MKQIRSDTGICHFRVETDVELRSFLLNADLSELSLQPEPRLVEEWMSTGAVYVDGQRARADRRLTHGQIIRLHTRRKRFPAADLGAWSERIVYQDSDLLVFDKPSGLPAHATLDNFVENAKFVLERELGEPLYTTHRLDVPTEGLLILAKTPRAQVRINKAFAQGRVKKIYHALTETEVASGPHTHYIDPSAHVPRPIRTEPQPGWWECRLEIEASGRQGSRYWHRIRLLTGKTHQIRAQLAALGAPVLNDEFYGGSHGAPFGLECYQLSLRFMERDLTFTRPKGLLEP